MSTTNPASRSFRAEPTATADTSAVVAQKSDHKEGDSFESGNPNRYKSMISGGNAKAVELPIEEMIDAIDEAVTESSNHTWNNDPLQAFLKDTMMMGDQLGGPVADGHTYLNVPDFSELTQLGLKSTAELKPIVDRYYGLQKVLEKLVGETKRSLEPSNSYKMSHGEIQAQRKYLSNLKKQMWDCLEQQTLAKKSYQAAKTTEEAERAAKKAKHETEHA